MGFLSLLGDVLASHDSDNELLPNRGDEVKLRHADNDALVGTYHSGDGTFKASKTVYPNGTVHETRTYKNK